MCIGVIHNINYIITYYSQDMQNYFIIINLFIL